MRVLVTGSRTWTRPEPIRTRLDTLWCEHGSDLTVIHGGAGRGADYIALNWCADVRRAGGWSVQVERYPADWTRYGKRAGILRNEEMVRAGADLCLAFIRDNSKGATHCARLAESKGIETRILRWEDVADAYR